MRAKFVRDNGGSTKYPHMELHGTGGLIEIVKDKRWRFEVINIPGAPCSKELTDAGKKPQAAKMGCIPCGVYCYSDLCFNRHLGGRSSTST